MRTCKSVPARSRKRPYVVAMVLGTALSAFGPASGLAAAPLAEAGPAIQDISRYCTACWRNARLHPDCWPDCTQEVFSRLLERVAPQAWKEALGAEGAERRELIRAIDAVKKRTQRTRKFPSIETENLADRREVQQRRLVTEIGAVFEVANKLLSTRQNQILQLACDGWSVNEIGGKLNLSPERVSDEKYKAIRKLRNHFSRS